ncbi:MAG: hypothetical protein HOE90_03680 [Bacteriovoracaceae bacterium]|jgi:hypothetical protein|nr:hypothetical protein [Bacteriovoracaceae bacterium]
MKYLFLAYCLFLSFHSFSQEIYSNNYDWKGIFISGDAKIANFDAGRTDISELFRSSGIDSQIHYSVDPNYVDDRTVFSPTAENLIAGFSALEINPELDGCLIHMTSHGAKGKGFLIRGLGIIPPKFISSVVNSYCGNAPTVILISACYSGQFITSSLAGDNRIILTAAHKNLPSFGCSADEEYTFWDGCIIEEMGKSVTWADLHSNVKTCISSKEKALGVRPSLPQSYFGKNVKDLEVPFQ